MRITGTVQVRCPRCGTEHQATLIQSINTREHPEDKSALLSGELDVLTCTCGKRTVLAAAVLYHDPDADYFCQVAPGGESAIASAVEAFRTAGSSGRHRVVPSLDALVEKVKILDAGLDDRAIELAKVLLLASLGEGELGRVLLFARADAEVVHWILFDDEGASPRTMASPRAAYDRIAARFSVTSDREPRIDRAWAVDRAREMISGAN